MSNWCKNMTKPKTEQLSLGRQFCNWAYDNCWKIIEFVVWTAVSIALLIYGASLSTEARDQLIKFMCLVGFVTVQPMERDRNGYYKHNKNYARYVPYILAIITIKCL